MIEKRFSYAGLKTGFKIFIGFLVFFGSFSICSAQDNDSGCKRTAYMGKCENLALPDDWEERSSDYYDCLSEQSSFDHEKCKHLLPDYGRKFSIYSEEAMFSSIRTWIPAVLHHDRFAMIQPGYVETFPIEYFFEATYDCARDAVIREHEDQYGNPIEDKLYPSSLNIRMYFDGEQKELVKEWTVNSSIHVWLSLTNRMFKFPGSLMRQDVPITNLLDIFEKKPEQCQIKPEKDELGEGQEIDIVLSEFRDALQQSSREFNRIIVHAQEGKILNGSRCEAGPDYRAFRLDEQPITVRYRAPKNGNASSDKITIYNSCEILPLEKQPLRVTKIMHGMDPLILRLQSVFNVTYKKKPVKLEMKK